MSALFTCSFCKSSFRSKCNLATHVKNAKYCLDIRGLKLMENGCKDCGNCFSSKVNLNKHEKICPAKNIIVKKMLAAKDAEIEEMKEQIEEIIRENEDEMIAVVEEKDSRIAELEDEVYELKLAIAESKGKISVYKERPGVVNTIINPKLLNIKCDTISPLTVENVKKDVDAGKYTYGDFIRAEGGLVDFIASLISDDDQKNYVCTDSARNKFHRLIETREWKEDNGANFLNKILDQLKESATAYYTKVVNMIENPEDRDLGELLMNKTKPMIMGITRPGSKDRSALFSRIRAEVRKLASV